MRLIDADALKYELGDTRDGEPIFRPTEFVRMDVIEKTIDEAPTVERPHVEWVRSLLQTLVDNGCITAIQANRILKEGEEE